MSEEQSDNFPDFTEITVSLVTIDGEPKDVPALAHAACPGLAVTMIPFGVFSVTHVATGLKMCRLHTRASTALLAMSEFALVAHMKGFSWSDLDQEQAGKLIREAEHDEVPFGGWTSTSEGVTRTMTVGEWFRALRFPLFDEYPWEAVDPYEDAICNLEKIGGPA